MRGSCRVECDAYTETGVIAPITGIGKSVLSGSLELEEEEEEEEDDEGAALGVCEVTGG